MRTAYCVLRISGAVEVGACRGQVGSSVWSRSTSERECVAGAAIWLCLSASEVEELQNPLLIDRPAGFRCLARYLDPSGRSRVSRGLTHRLRDDLCGRRSFHVVVRLMSLIRQFRLPVDHAHCCPALSPPCPCGSSRASIGLCIDAPCVITPSNRM